MIKKVISILVACIFTLDTFTFASSQTLQPPLSSYAPPDTISVEAAIVGFIKGLNLPVSEINIDGYPLSIGGERVYISFRGKRKNGDNWVIPCRTASTEYEAIVDADGTVTIRKIDPRWSLPPTPIGGGDDSVSRGDDEPLSPDWHTQQRAQDLSLESFSFLSLDDKRSDFVFWCDWLGFHVNPSINSLSSLDSLGISQHNINYLIITDPLFSASGAFLQKILQGERIKLITTPAIFDRLIRETNELLGKEFDAKAWIDFLPLTQDKPLIIGGPQGRIKFEIKDTLPDHTTLLVSYKGKTLSQDELSADSGVIIKRSAQEQAKWLMDFLSKVSLLRHVDKRDRDIVAKKSTIQSFKPGEPILLKGDESDACYIVISGKAEVVEGGEFIETGREKRLIGGRSIWPFEALDFFGEVGVQTNEKRSASIRAKTFLRLLKVDKDVYTNNIYNPLRGTASFNTVRYQLEEWFKKVSPETVVAATTIEEIVLRSKIEDFEGINQGERGDSAYILMEGELEVTKKDPKSQRTFTKRLKPFTLFGEMALLGPSPIRTASVRPIGRAVVLKITRDVFEFILYRYPGLDKGIREEIIRRRRENRQALFKPHKVSVPSYLTEGYDTTSPSQEVLLNFRNFLDRLKIDLVLKDISQGEIEEYAPKFEIIYGILKDIFGEALLERGYLQSIMIASLEGQRTIVYDREKKAITLPKKILNPSTSLRADIENTEFSRIVLSGLGEVLLHYLREEEFLQNEKESLEKALDIIIENIGSLKDALPVLPQRDELLIVLLRLYILKPDQLRELLKPESNLPDVLRNALSEIYRLYKDVAFLGREYTHKKPSTAIIPRRSITDRIKKKEWSVERVSRSIEAIINGVFNEYGSSDSASFRSQFYDTSIYQKTKLDLLRELGKSFTYFNLQRFYDDLIEISVYDPPHKASILVRARRVREKKIFAWKVEETPDTRELDHPPVNITLVNLESPQFGGVKGTPENIKALQAYLEEHRQHTASISLFDCQWPENDLEFLMDQLSTHPPNILAISSTFGCLKGLEKLLNCLNRMRNKPLVVVGGLMSTWSYEYILEKYPEVICVRFEGEEALTNLIDSVARVPSKNVREVIKQSLPSIQNLAFSENGEIYTTARRFVDLEKSRAPSRSTQLRRQMQAKWLLNSEGMARGCGYGGCFFCTRTHGKFRMFPLERGLADFESYMEGGAPFIVYADEDFPLDQKFAQHLIALREGYKAKCLERGEKEPVLPSFYIAIRANTIYKEGDEAGNKERLEALRLFKKAGLVKIFLGGESGAPVQFHKTYHKEASIHEVEKAIEVIKGEGIQVVVGFITFDPVVTLNQLSQNLVFMERNGLVDVDPLTEPLNPFKYFRAQVGSTLTRKFQDVGFLASSFDPDSLMYDTVYRNPLVRVITGVGDVWKGQIDELEYHLKGVIWYAEQSEEEMEKARLFIELFNKLRQESFHLVKELLKLKEKEQLKIDEREAIRAFIDQLRGLPLEKLLFEIERVLFPHKDIFSNVRNYIRNHENKDGFDIYAFLVQFFNGEFPEDFDFSLGKSSAAEYREWLEDVRADLSQGMLDAAALERFIALSEDVLRSSLARRKVILEEFAGSRWKDYYQEYPEAVARGREFQGVLNAALSGHRKVLEESRETLLTRDILSIQPYKIYWRASLGDFLSYRHPDPSLPLKVLIDVFRQIKDSPPGSYPSSLEDVYVHEGLKIKYKKVAKKADVLEFVKKCIEKFFINGTSVDADYFKDAMAIYLDIKENRLTNLDEIITRLITLYRKVGREKVIRESGMDLAFSSESLDERCLVRLVGFKGVPERTFEMSGFHMPSRVTIDFKGKDAIPHSFWKKVLQLNLPEQERFNIVNACVEIFSNLADTGDQWKEDLAGLIDKNVSPLTVYLPDSGRVEYISWQREYPNVRFIYVHPKIYERVWPGIEKHLKKVIMLAQAHLMDDFEAMLDMVKRGEVSPSWIQFIYESFFNRINPDAFYSNERPEEIIRQYTTISRRVMPKKTPVVLINKNDKRLDIFPSHHEDVKAFMEVGEDVRLVIHPQVYDYWKARDELPFKDERFEWALVYPTASCRTLYVLDSDIIAKTHSSIAVGPAVRRLKRDNVVHSVKISERILSTIDERELPPNIEDEFAYSSESGVVLNDSAYYSEGIGAIYRSPAAYPISGDKNRILVPAFSLHNNSISVDANAKPDVLVQLIEHNVSKTGEDRIEFFIRNILRPLYRAFDYFIFKQGILLEPHGQNLFVEIDEEARIKRLVFKDWQSTMVDMETNIRRDLGLKDIEKHRLGEEASIPLSLSLVIDHYFGHYLFEQIINTLVEEYHGNIPEVEYRERLIARFKEIFEEEMGLYKERADRFPDFYVRHDNEKKKEDNRRRKEEGLEPSNQVFFKTDGPPEFRPTSLEREILKIVEKGTSRGTVEIALRSLVDETAEVRIVDEPSTVTLDLDRTGLYVNKKGAYLQILPPNFEVKKKYPLLVFLHGMGSTVMEVSSWAESIGIKDAIILVPFGPHVVGDMRFSWFKEDSQEVTVQDKKISHDYLVEIVNGIKKEFNTGECVIGGISQGGHMALYSTLMAPQVFDSFFSINAPFKEEYLAGTVIPAPDRSRGQASAGIHKQALLLHMENDEVVSVAHSERLEAFLEQRSFNVERQLYITGAHHRLSPVMAEDISDWLKRNLETQEESFGKEIPSVEAVRDLAERPQVDENDITTLKQIIYEIGRKRQKGYEGILYEIMLDPAKSFSLRLAALSALEKLKFSAVSEETSSQISLLSRIQRAQEKNATTERIIAFLTSYMASSEEVPPNLLNDFYVLISSFRRITYMFRRLTGAPEAVTQKEKITKVIQQAEWLYSHALDLQREVIKFSLGPVGAARTAKPDANGERGVLRDITQEDQLALCLVEEIISLKLNKEVVLIFDETIALCQEGGPFRNFLQALEELKQNERYKKILGNLKIETALPENMQGKITGYMGKENTEVFMFAPEKSRDTLRGIEQRVRSIYIDEAGFNTSAYYPLAEIVVIALAESIVPSILEGKGEVTILTASGEELKLSDLNISAIINDNKVLIFKLLPNAGAQNPQDIINRYTQLKRFLNSA